MVRHQLGPRCNERVPPQACKPRSTWPSVPAVLVLRPACAWIMSQRKFRSHRPKPCLWCPGSPCCRRGVRWPWRTNLCQHHSLGAGILGGGVGGCTGRCELVGELRVLGDSALWLSALLGSTPDLVDVCWKQAGFWWPEHACKGACSAALPFQHSASAQTGSSQPSSRPCQLAKWTATCVYVARLAVEGCRCLIVESARYWLHLLRRLRGCCWPSTARRHHNALRCKRGP